MLLITTTVYYYSVLQSPAQCTVPLSDRPGAPVLLRQYQGNVRIPPAHRHRRHHREGWTDREERHPVRCAVWRHETETLTSDCTDWGSQVLIIRW